MQSFILPANGAATPKSIERKRKMAEAMLSSGIETSPIASPWQGAARIAQALVGGLASRKADKQEAEGTQSAREAMVKALNGGGKMDFADALSNPFMDNNSADMVSKAYNQQFNPEMAGGPEYGLQPIITQDDTGKYHLFQASKAGGPPKEIELPYGWMPQQQYLDTGTGFQAMPKVGSGQGAMVPKDVAGQQVQEEIGTNIGKKIAAAPNDIQAADNALAIINSLRTDPNKARGTGMTSIFNAIPGTAGKSFQKKVDQATAGAFMTGIQAMRGMGALSDAEGRRASDAVARMDTATTEEEFDKALNDYEGIVRQAKAKAETFLQGQGQAQPIPAPIVEEEYDAQGNRIN